ncbi:beta-cyclopiazonate dehydrogenase [Staphylotrichum tortipilum]|uniref:Beta-cyclopiazonate dehydrogenase n=1 Tax=Staphylotrichum tortipilum TaxID=2831512 RepID=A0AAN6MCT9_9PEZI|nr:beta-cyclopiazonate dehydrogenase [Staphylotrichum longicolle]
MAPALRLAGSLLAAASAVTATGGWLPEIISRDVAIIGGGASGSYAAIRLKEDFGKSVVVVEKANRMGGHVSTYDDPKTGLPFDFGVQSFNDYGPARAFFQRMGVPVSAAPRNALVSQWADFTTGAAVNFTPPANADRVAALGRFLNATAAYEQYFLPGYWNFPAADQIPEDLLLPFGEFVAKYQLEAAVNQVFQVTGMGAGDMVNALTLYVLGAFGQPMIRAFLGQGATFTPDVRRNMALYEAIQTRLGDDVLLSTTVIQALRTPIGHTLWTKSASGKNTIIIARKLLMAIEPTTANMEPFGLDLVEASIFNKFKYSHIHAGVVAHPSLPAGKSIVNLPAAAAPSNYLALPKLNYNVRFDHMGGNSDLFRVMMVGTENFDKDQAQALVRQNLAKLAAGGIVPATADPAAELEIRAWADHGAMHMHVDASELRSGFIQKLYALQGRRETWWTGGAFSVQFQAILWAFDDILLPKMLA